MTSNVLNINQKRSNGPCAETPSPSHSIRC